MEKNPKNLNSASVPRQLFFVPQCAPFLELRTTRDSTLPYAQHVHAAFSVGLILQGKTRFTLGDEEYLAEKGDIVLIAQGRTHSCNPVDGPRGYHMLLIDADWLHAHIPGELAFNAPLVKDATLFPHALAVMDAILANHEHAPSMLVELLLHLRTRHGRGVGKEELHPRAWPGPETMITMRELNETDAGLLSVSALARRVGMCRESFSRAVRRKTGLPPSLYIHCLRLEKARRLLRQGKSIAEAALAAGYADQSHFHRVFVKFCAVTPGRYRSGMSHPYKK